MKFINLSLLLFLAIYFVPTSALAQVSSIESEVSTQFKVRSEDEVLKLKTSLNKKFSDFYKNLNADSHKALKNYCNYGFHKINKCLRKENCTMEMFDENIYPADEAFELVPDLALSKLHVYRGHNYLPEGATKPGFKFSDKGYTSTSISFKIAKQFSHEKIPHVIDMILLSPSLIDRALWTLPIATYTKELEILLPRGIEFEVLEHRLVDHKLKEKVHYRVLRAY